MPTREHDCMIRGAGRFTGRRMVNVILVNIETKYLIELESKRRRSGSSRPPFVQMMVLGVIGGESRNPRRA